MSFHEKQKMIAYIHLIIFIFIIYLTLVSVKGFYLNFIYVISYDKRCIYNKLVD